MSAFLQIPAILIFLLYAATPVMAKRIGIVFGTNYKENTADIPPLDLCERDAKLMEETLKKHGRFDEIKVLLGRMVTASAMEQAIKDVARTSGKEDTVLIYFTGHGAFQKETGAPNGLRNYIIMYNRPHVPDSMLNDWLKGVKSNKTVLIFDACFSGGIAKKGRRQRGVGNVPVSEAGGLVIQDGDESFYFDGKSVIGSSDSNETSIEITGGGVDHGVFTYWFAQGFDPQNGDLNHDKSVTVLEAFEWSSRRITEMAQKLQHSQHPQISGNASGILIAGNIEPTPPPAVQQTVPVKPEPTKPPEQTPEAIKPELPTVVQQVQEPVKPEVSPIKPPSTPSSPEIAVASSEPPAVPTEVRGGVMLVTTILEMRQAGQTTLDPVKRLRQRREGNKRRNIRVLISDQVYPFEIEWVDQQRLKQVSGENIALGKYTWDMKEYSNRVAVIRIKDVPTGVHEIKIEADDYPLYRERLGVENRQDNKLLVVASLAGYGTIRGKVFRENFETPVAGHTVWMPSVTGINQIHKMITTSDGSFWFLNLPESSDYRIKATFEENLALDNERFTVKSGDVVKIDVVLGKKFLGKK
jgi:uncharacterized caspase-like protein